MCVPRLWRGERPSGGTGKEKKGSSSSSVLSRKEKRGKSYGRSPPSSLLSFPYQAANGGAKRRLERTVDVASLCLLPEKRPLGKIPA